MKVYEVIIDDANMAGGVNAISLVDSPAIESNFITLAAEAEEGYQLAAVDDEKQLLMGAVLIPNKPILRLDENGEKFYIVFSKETIRKASQLFFQRGNQSETTEMHRVALAGNTVVESWIKEDVEKDKSALYDLGDVPLGSWVISMKVEDAATFEKAKAGELRGFSIEGFFQPEEREQLGSVYQLEQKKYKTARAVLEGIREALNEYADGQ